MSSAATATRGSNTGKPGVASMASAAGIAGGKPNMANVRR